MKGGSHERGTAALVLNLLILPGLGTIIAGRVREGVWQICICVLGVLFTIIGIVRFLAQLSDVQELVQLVVLGLLLALGSWIWSIITGVRIIDGK